MDTNQKILELEYFGTDLDSCGHYFWKLSEDKITMNMEMWFDKIPFNPEEFTNNLNKGAVVYSNESGYSICAIAGSCRDKRIGCKSVFWTKQKVDNWKDLIESIPIAKKMIDQMPFSIMWPENNYPNPT